MAAALCWPSGDRATPVNVLYSTSSTYSRYCVGAVRASQNNGCSFLVSTTKNRKVAREQRSRVRLMVALFVVSRCLFAALHATSAHLTNETATPICMSDYGCDERAQQLERRQAIPVNPAM
jgi:alkylhydroperoxidase family enzyme